MITWVINNIVGITGILIGGFVAYHIYSLSKKLTFRDRMSNMQEIKKQSYKILNEVRNGISRKVEIINTKKYKKHYPHNNDMTKHGFTYLGAEIKGPKYDGIEFFCDMPQCLYIDEDENFTLKKTGKNAEFNVYPVGLIPYEWIEYVDTNGDEFSYRPQLFVQFRGKGKCPYKEVRYYKRSDVFEKDRDPLEMEYVETVDIKSTTISFISKLAGKLRVR